VDIPAATACGTSDAFIVASSVSVAVLTSYIPEFGSGGKNKKHPGRWYCAAITRTGIGLAEDTPVHPVR